MDLKLHIKEVGCVPVIELQGEMDGYNSSGLRDYVLSLLEKGQSRIVINLDGVDYMDSRSLGAMVGILRRMDERKGSLCLSCSNPLISKVFRVTGLSSLFSIQPSDEAAIASLQ